MIVGTQGPGSGSPTPAQFGEMSIVGNGTPMSLATANTFYKITVGWIAEEANGITLSTVNSNMTIGMTAEYMITCTLSVSPGSGNHNYVAAIYKNGAALPEHNAAIRLTTTDVETITLVGLDPFNAGDVIDVRITCDTNTNTITIVNSDFSIWAVLGA